MTIDIRTTHQQREGALPALHVQTLKDLAPRDAHQVIGGASSDTRQTSTFATC